MAKKSSERVMRQRRRDYDRISFTVPKDIRHLIRVQALRDGLSAAETIRRAILARCGLESMPDTAAAAYQAIRDAETKTEAERAISRLQFACPVFLAQDQNDKDRTETATVCLGYEQRNAKSNYVFSLLSMLDAVEDMPDPPPGNEWQDPTSIKIPQGAISALRRLLSNIEIVSDDAEELTDSDTE